MWATKVNVFCVSIFLKIEECEVGNMGFLIYTSILGKIQYLKGCMVPNIWLDIYKHVRNLEAVVFILETSVHKYVQ